MNQLERLNTNNSETLTLDKQPDRINTKNSPGLFISPESRQVLLDAIIPFVDIPHRDALSKLILEGVTPSNPIPHNLAQNILAHFFYQLLKEKKATASQIDLSKWICSNFTPAIYSTIYDVVRGEKLPSKAKQIEINLK